MTKTPLRNILGCSTKNKAIMQVFCLKRNKIYSPVEMHLLIDLLEMQDFE